jgi:hypothetical protein
MSGKMSEEVFKKALLTLLDETPARNHGIALNKSTSFHKTLSRVTAERASRLTGLRTRP